MIYRLRPLRTNSAPSSPARTSLELRKILKQRDVSLRNFGHWSSEIYGYGRLYRRLLHWSRLHPLPFTSEHGVPFGTSSLRYASEGPYTRGCQPLHLTWNSEVHGEAKRQGILSIRIPHPWSVGWRMDGKNRNVIWDGPILLVPHSLPQVTTTREREFWGAFLDRTMADVPPSAALISHHDLGGIAEHEIIRRQIPVFSLGRATGDLFYDNFYDIIGQFTYVVSPNLSSAAFYSTDFGVPFQLVGDELEFNYQTIRSGMGSKGHELHNRVEFKRTATNLFSTSVAKRSDLEKKKIEEFVRSELSLDLLGFQFDSLGAELTGRRSAVLATRMLATNVLRRASRGVSE